MEALDDTMSDRTSLRPLGVAHFSAIAVAPPEFVTLAARAGFTSVGLRLHPAFSGAPYYALPPGSPAAREVKTRLDDENIAVYDIEFVVISADFEAAALMPVLEAAAALGARRLSVCGDDSERTRLLENVAALCERAAPFGIGIDLENMGWRAIATYSESLSLLRELGQENAGVLVDALHFFRNGAHVDDLALAPPGLIRSAQLCDVRGQAPQTHEDMVREARSGRIAPGLGELPLTGFLKALPKEAVLSIEVPIMDGETPERHLGQLYSAARMLMG